jgi:cation-transporting P-type ATPase I
MAVAKSVAATPGADVADRTCMLFDGTTVVAGSGRALVVAVGAPPPAGVQARLGELPRSVLPAHPRRRWPGHPARGAVAPSAAGGGPLGVAIAVAAVPEGLPLVATVAQQSAARRLSRRGAVVRSARVLEALGRMDTVCFDKTGTLTENRLRLARLVPLSAGDEQEEELLRMAAAAVANGDNQAHETDRAVAEAAEERGLAVKDDAGAACPSPPDAGSPRRSATAGWW